MSNLQCTFFLYQTHIIELQNMMIQPQQKPPQQPRKPKIMTPQFPDLQSNSYNHRHSKNSDIDNDINKLHQQPMISQYDYQNNDQRQQMLSGSLKSNQTYCLRCLCSKLCCCCSSLFNDNLTNIERTVYLNGQTQPKNRTSNSINNQKYNLINFLPLVLFYQFKLFFNFFQLAIMLSQLIPLLKVGFLFTYLSPLVMVMLLTLGKQAYDDLQRYTRDKQANSSKYKYLYYNHISLRIIKGNSIKDTTSSSLKPGDIIQVNAKQRIPADLVILSTSQPTGSIFIKTDQLDGQTDWKVRRAIRSTHSKMFTDKFVYIDGKVVYAPACDDIYDFAGSFVNYSGGDGQVGGMSQESGKGQLNNNNNNQHLHNHDSEHKQVKKQSLSLDNTAWSNTVLAAGHLIGLVIFTGHQTRSQMNSHSPTPKIGKFDSQINHLSKILFLIMLILALIMNVFRQITLLWPLYYFRYVLLLASIIPISLRVNLDFCKTYFSYKISNDQEFMPGAVCRNSAIPQELGRVQYLLSDKTGTLTYNDMVFKKLSVNEQLYISEQMEDIKKGIIKACKKFVGPIGDLHDQQFLKKKMKRKQECLLRDLASALILCNNVTPVQDQGNRVLQASSPDQIALVKFVQSLNFTITSRDKQYINIMNPLQQQQKYTILANFPFSSQTKRMGIILKHQQTSRIIFYVKGADMVMISKCKAIYQGYIQDQCDNLARQGLRTLVIAQKQLTEEVYQEWNRRYEKASNLLKNRHQAMQKVVDTIEKDLELVGITGVQDKLQDEVAVTIQSLRMAGIKIWMLTGDKVQTAKCIAISAGLKGINQTIYEVRGGQDQLIIRKKLLEYDNNSEQMLLLVDGQALTNILNTNNSSLFFEVARKAPAVICCRCLPTQKALITQKMKQLTGTIVAGIGDGGNDVGMIQLASIGLGIVGKQGNQAALASDVSMLQFKHVKNLLLYHGRNSYKRAATLSQFVIHRGLIISILQMAFSIIFYNVAIPIYNGMLMLGYATFYTSLPVFALILDQDLSRQKTLLYPNLYITLRKSRQMNTKTFLVWLWISIYQGVLIMTLSLQLFEQSFVRIVTITFTALIISQLLNVSTTIHQINRYIIGSQILTLIIYGLSLLLVSNYLDTSRIDLAFTWKVTAIVAAAWIPIYFVKCVRKRCSPTQEDKIKQ